MNHYGRAAMAHWEKHAPKRFAALENPKAFFSSLGEQVSDEVSTATLNLEHQNRETLNEADYLTRVGLMNNIRSQAEEVILTELVWVSDDPPTSATGEAEQDLAEWVTYDGMPTDRDHHLWQMQEDDNVSVEAFLTARREWETQRRARLMRGETPI